MTKFEEEAIKEAEKCGYVMAKSKIVFYEDEKGITFVDFNGTHTNFNFPWLEFAKNWHSDEEFQELKEQHGNQAESILLMLEEIDSLKSQLQQQALPVVPDFVGEAVIGIDLDYLFSGYSNGINEKAKEWLEKHRGVKSLGYYICQLRFQGFTIEKPQLFKAVFPNSTSVLQKNGELNSFADTVYKRYLLDNAMTEQEIKSIDERYWKFAVPVEDGE